MESRRNLFIKKLTQITMLIIYLISIKYDSTEYQGWLI